MGYIVRCLYQSFKFSEYFFFINKTPLNNNLSKQIIKIIRELDIRKSKDVILST